MDENNVNIILPFPKELFYIAFGGKIVIA